MKKIIILGLVLSLLFISGCYNKCDIVLEQLTSCYKGCQFATQPTYNITPIEESGVRIKLYDNCVSLCRNKYCLEFDTEGSITNCKCA